MKGLVYKVYQIPETFHNYILPLNQMCPLIDESFFEKITEFSATEEFEIFLSEYEARIISRSENYFRRKPINIKSIINITIDTVNFIGQKSYCFLKVFFLSFGSWNSAN
jgi:hypothetical protein